MAKKKQKPAQYTINKKVLWSAVLVCLIIIGGLTTLLIRQNTKSPSQSGIHVSLGAMTWHLVNGRAKIQGDAKTDALKAKLTAMGHKDLQLGCVSTSYLVSHFTKDENQALLSYGCTMSNDNPVYGMASMYALYKNGAWQTLSPTNEFNDFGIPFCDYVDKNGIDISIAPICASNTPNPTPPQSWPASAPSIYVVRS